MRISSLVCELDCVGHCWVPYTVGHRFSIIKRLASIAGKYETYTLDESTVSKLKEIFPSNKFVKELFEEVRGGRTIDEKVFFRFLKRNTGFLAIALKLCCTYNKNTGEQIAGLDGTHLKGDLSLPEKDVVLFLNNRGFLTWEEAAGRIYFFGGYEEAKSQATTGKSQKQPRTGCC
ncbi:uncharacterized protein LOC120349594 [Nilaparvata lugens]|uniref:uncharacterized protein LOC120349594 n=1 Tax=Nilaparvata lugens TaxID=108931 RepID=UPI00193D7CD9|nr:uncharacterized protein LOC120349594 [Nilaparvata lugens]